MSSSNWISEYVYTDRALDRIKREALTRNQDMCTLTVPWIYKRVVLTRYQNMCTLTGPWIE